MSHAHRADKLLIKPAAGARPAPPRAQTDHSQGTHTAASHPTSHTRHGEHQAGNGPRQTTSRVLPSPEPLFLPFRDGPHRASLLWR
jgi:hypothetical protein